MMELEEQVIELVLQFIRKHGDTQEHDEAGRLLAEVRAERASFEERRRAHYAQLHEPTAGEGQAAAAAEIVGDAADESAEAEAPSEEEAPQE